MSYGQKMLESHHWLQGWVAWDSSREDLNQEGNQCAFEEEKKYGRMEWSGVFVKNISFQHGRTCVQKSVLSMDPQENVAD